MDGRIGFAVAGLSMLLGALACGGGDEGSQPAVAAAALESGRFGAIMASADGDVLLPIVDRDAAGKVTGPVRGVLWMSDRGGRVAVLLDPATGLPARTVVGDYVLVFANWDTAAGTVDVARTFGPTGYVEVIRGASVPAVKETGDAAGAVVSALTCFPKCPSELKNLSEMLKIGGAGLSIASCATATAVTLGALLVPCGGALISAASLALPEDPWLGDVEQVGRILALGDALKCTRGSAADCVSFFNTVATEALDLVDGTLSKHQATIAKAEESLMGPGQFAGVLAGTPPPCGNAYECTPGAYLPCLAGGTRTCGADCRWGDCPPPGAQPLEEGVGRFDGAWTFELSFGPCGPTSGLPQSGAFSIANGVFAPGVLFSYDAYGTMETVTLLEGAVDARGELEGYFSLLGAGCNDEHSHFYGYMTSPTAGYATSYWGSIRFRR